VIGAFLTVNDASVATDASSARASTVLSPTRRLATRPVSARPVASGWNWPVASAPLTSTRTREAGTPCGSSTRTSASPPLTTSGRDDSVLSCREGVDEPPSPSEPQPTSASEAISTASGAFTW
jgi:hypothetical protein